MIPYEQLALAFQARHLAVPMEQAFCLEPDEPVAGALEKLRARHFDQAPVVRSSRITGFVLEAQLANAESQAFVRDFVQELQPGNVVSADAPVGRLLEWIIDPGLLFVIDGRDITGFVTVSDFNKQPARAYFYLLLATVETGLAEAVRARFGEQQEAALTLLAPQQAHAVRKQFQDDVATNTEADIVACLNFSHLLKITTADEPLSATLGSISSDLEKSRSELVEMRNQVMHPVQSLVTRKQSLIRLQERERLLHATALALEVALTPPAGVGPDAA